MSVVENLDEAQVVVAGETVEACRFWEGIHRIGMHGGKVIS